ncbi:MAG: putative chromate transport protein [Flavobacteriales bacterium]|nr:putative chromate transport protein [Flavobacteriales bacterium]
MNNNLKEVATVFFKMGCFAFGGPAAHIAMMEQEVVEKRKWMTKEHFLDLIGVTNLIPGPNSTEMTMHCGHERAGKVGLFVAGLAFIIPAIIITGVLAWAYTTYGELPNIKPFIQGIQPTVIAIILAAVITLGKKALKTTELAIIGVLAFALCLLGVNEIIALIGVGILGGIYFNLKSANNSTTTKKYVLPFLLIPTTTLALAKITSLKLFLIFLKVGAVLYGSGYVLFAYLDAELVTKGYLTQQQLMDAVAAGQFTPGPVLSTATFIGYQINGIWGALAATTGIFLPSFLFVLLLNPIIPKLRASKFFGHFLNAVNASSIAVIAAVMVTMSIETLTNLNAIIILAVSLLLTFVVKLNVMLIIVIGAVLGFILPMVI